MTALPTPDSPGDVELLERLLRVPIVGPVRSWLAQPPVGIFGNAARGTPGVPRRRRRVHLADVSLPAAVYLLRRRRPASITSALVPVLLRAGRLWCLDLTEPGEPHVVHLPITSLGDIVRTNMTLTSLAGLATQRPTLDDVLAGAGITCPIDHPARAYWQPDDNVGLRATGAYHVRRWTHDTRSLDWALFTLHGATIPPPSCVIPLVPVDETSIACVDLASGMHNGEDRILRWHLDDVPEHLQGRILDRGVQAFMAGWSAERDDRPGGLDRFARVVDAVGSSRGGDLARPTEPRPVRLASQNVLLGLTCLRYDELTEHTDVFEWLTCEVPHLATLEGTRGLLAQVLCDTFRNGGTMELRFRRVDMPEGPEAGGRVVRGPICAIPPAVARFARAHSIELAEARRGRVTPAESRELFRASAALQVGLLAQINECCSQYGIAPERLYYLTLEGAWSPVELSHLLTSAAAAGVLNGGSTALERVARQLELAACRRAVMVGALYHRLQLPTAFASERLDVVEDERLPVAWHMADDGSSVAFDGPDGTVPWCATPFEHGGRIVGLPWSGSLSRLDVLAELAAPWIDEPETIVGVIAPRGVRLRLPHGVVRLVYPGSTEQLDREIDRRLVRARVRLVG